MSCRATAGRGVAGDKHLASAFRVDPASGALQPHGEPQALPSRPIHTSVDKSGEYLLTAYNDPSNVTVLITSGPVMNMCEVILGTVASSRTAAWRLGDAAPPCSVPGRSPARR